MTTRDFFLIFLRESVRERFGCLVLTCTRTHTTLKENDHDDNYNEFGKIICREKKKKNNLEKKAEKIKIRE